MTFTQLSFYLCVALLCYQTTNKNVIEYLQYPRHWWIVKSGENSNIPQEFVKDNVTFEKSIFFSFCLKKIAGSSITMTLLPKEKPDEQQCGTLPCKFTKAYLISIFTENIPNARKINSAF